MTDEMAASTGGRRRRVLLFPLPFQGHINPMFQLADVLHSRGFAITILHTRFNSPDPAGHPDYRFAAVPDDIPAELSDSGNVVAIILALNAGFEASASFRDCLAAVLSEEPAACLVIDANWLAAQKAAARLGLPTLVLRTGSAVCFGVFLAYPMLCQKGYLPRQESQLDMPVSELPPLRVRDLFHSSRNTHDMLYQCLTRAVEAVRNSSGLMINTFDALENSELEKIRHELSHIVVLATGPLHKLSPNSSSSSSSLMAQDRSCLEWLDARPPESVLYVSFGSLASLDPDEFVEVAWGLASSNQPFLWVVRPDSVPGSQSVRLPDGFEDETRDRGKIVRWAPQQEVLSRPSIGGFWTHNGWNSTLESVCEGVPMLCRPQFADQMMNARYVEHVWKVGFELEGKLERGKIERAIGRLMREREGAQMRERAKVLKVKAAQCMDRGGSSRLAIDKLVDHILSL